MAMKRMLACAVAGALLAVLGWTGEAAAHHGGAKNFIARWQSQTYPWHGDYYDVAWGVPVAVVVPPTAENQTHWGWGVGSTKVNSIQHQFHRNYPGPGIGGRGWFRPTPQWPSSTDQMGDYYVRGPW